MKARSFLKTTGFLTLFGISIYLSLSLNAQLAQPKGKFSLLQMAESEGWCQSLSQVHSQVHSQAHYMVYAFYDPKETIVLFNDQDDPTSPLYTNPLLTDPPFYGAGYWANYPEVVFVTLVAVKVNPDTGVISLYDGSDGDIMVEMRLKKTGKSDPDSKYIDFELQYQLVDLTENDLALSNVDATLSLSRKWKLQKEDWKGFFRALDETDINSLKEALSETSLYDGNIYPAPRNDLTIVIKDKPVHVIAVKSWNYKNEIKDFIFKLENVKGSGYAKAKLCSFAGKGNKEVLVKSNVDNVDFVRANIQGSNLGDLRPPVGGNYTGDPGPFVVEINTCIGTRRPYSEIIEILVEAAANDPGKEPPQSGGGVDWIQVAATDIYNNEDRNTEDVFKCVWKVVSIEEIEDIMMNVGGTVNEKTPYIVHLNPYHYELRFNLPKTSAYDFTTRKTRDHVVHHESLHSYQFLPGKGVFDEEDGGKGDNLVVGFLDGPNPYFIFCYDEGKPNEKSRGFLSPNPNFVSPLPVPIVNTPEPEMLLQGLSGEGDKYKDCIKLQFITRIDDKLIRDADPAKDELEMIFGKKATGLTRLIPTDMPEDIPCCSIGAPVDAPKAIEHIYLYKPGKPIYLLSGTPKSSADYAWPFIRFVSEKSRKETDYGHYTPATVFFKLDPYKNSFRINSYYPKPEKCLQLIKQGYRLYIDYTVASGQSIISSFRFPEYDAENFGIRRKPRESYE